MNKNNTVGFILKKVKENEKTIEYIKKELLKDLGSENFSEALSKVKFLKMKQDEMIKLLSLEVKEGE